MLPVSTVTTVAQRLSTLVAPAVPVHAAPGGASALSGVVSVSPIEFVVMFGSGWGRYSIDPALPTRSSTFGSRGCVSFCARASPGARPRAAAPDARSILLIVLMTPPVGKGGTSARGEGPDEEPAAQHFAADRVVRRRRRRARARTCHGGQAHRPRGRRRDVPEHERLGRRRARVRGGVPRRREAVAL